MAQMKPLFYLIAIFGLLLAQSATAQIHGSPYLGVDAGASLLNGTMVHDTWLPYSYKAEFDPGYRLGLKLGYLVPDGALLRSRRSEAVCDFAVELDTGLICNPVSAVGGDLSATGTSIDFYQVPLVANMMVAIPLSEQWSVSIGGGLGGSFTIITVSQPFGPDDSSTDFGFAYQGLARVAYRFSSHLSANAFAKVMGSDTASFPDGTRLSSGGMVLTPGKIDGPLGFSFGLGLTWLF